MQPVRNYPSATAGDGYVTLSHGPRRVRLNLTRFHGVFAPNFTHRGRIAPRRAQSRIDRDQPLAPMTWAQRLKRVFAIDIETCPDCGGKRGIPPREGYRRRGLVDQSFSSEISVEDPQLMDVLLDL